MEDERTGGLWTEAHMISVCLERTGARRKKIQPSPARLRRFYGSQHEAFPVFKNPFVVKPLNEIVNDDLSIRCVQG